MARPRLERLRGFGARLGQLVTCACSRLELRDGGTGVLVVAVDASIRVAPPAPLPIAPIELRADDVSPERESIVDEEPAAAPAAVMQTDDTHAGGDVASPDELTRFENAEVDISVQAETTPSPIVDREDDSSMDARPPMAAAHPLRFVWQIDAADRFWLSSDEFLRIAGERTVLAQGQAWTEVARALDLDPHGRIAQVIGARETFSGIAAHWPLEDRTRARVELSGMPIFDGARNFAGYRGFGICRLDATFADDRRAPSPVSDALPEPPQSKQLDHSTPVDVPAVPASESFSQPEIDIVEPPPERRAVPACERHANAIAERGRKSCLRRDRSATDAELRRSRQPSGRTGGAGDTGGARYAA